ncbi:MAG TPA: NADH-quinone oxidoreductase subunit NuoH [Longimicrobiales bacterium]
MHNVGALTGWALLIVTSIKILIVFTTIMITVALLTLAERRVSAWIQDRLGPNRVGPQGLLQPVADGIKNFIKEETYPAHASRAYFLLAPTLALVPALMTMAEVPVAAPLPTRWGLVEMIVADVPIGILYILALTGLGVYGIVMAGWSSNNKYAFLGGMRASAQMVSYEVAMGMSLIPVFMLAGNVTLTQIVATQQGNGGLGVWLALPLGLSFFIFVCAAFAETNRLPFDMAEAESELVAGFHSEYSSMKFSMFPIAEYAGMLTASALMATLFFGGWDVPILQFDDMRVVAPGVVMGAAPAWWKTVITLGMFSVKTLFFCFVYIWVRWTVPRFRYDQIMDLGWKVLLPTALAYIMLMGSSILILDRLGLPYGWKYGLILTVVNLAATAVFMFILDRGRVIRGSYGGRHMDEVRGRIEKGYVNTVPARREIKTGAGVR